MLQSRREKIMEMIQAERMIKVSDLIKQFGVSIETIRRDLEFLEKEGLLTRVYGGAVLNQKKAAEPLYEHREVKNYEEKAAIARRAVELIEDGDVLGIDIGTTAREFARALLGKRKVIVLTNSMPIAEILSGDDDIRVIMLGGEVRKGEFSVSGFVAENIMQHFNLDKYILGIGGITVENGITDYHIEETNLRRVMLSRAQKVIGLADYSKFGVIAMNTVCPLSRMDVLVTDGRAGSEHHRENAFHEDGSDPGGDRRKVRAHFKGPEADSKPGKDWPVYTDTAKGWKP